MRNSRVVVVVNPADEYPGHCATESDVAFPAYEKPDYIHINTGDLTKIDLAAFLKRRHDSHVFDQPYVELVKAGKRGYFGFAYSICKGCRRLNVSLPSRDAVLSVYRAIKNGDEDVLGIIPADFMFTESSIEN